MVEILQNFVAFSEYMNFTTSGEATEVFRGCFEKKLWIEWWNFFLKTICKQAFSFIKDKDQKFIYSERATKFCEISTVDLSYVVAVKSTVEISQNFVAFSEYYMNFKNVTHEDSNLQWENHGKGFHQNIFSRDPGSICFFEIFLTFHHRVEFLNHLKVRDWKIFARSPLKPIYLSRLLISSQLKEL